MNWPDSPLCIPADPTWDGKAAALTGGTATVTRGDGQLVIEVSEPDRHPSTRSSCSTASTRAHRHP